MPATQVHIIDPSAGGMIVVLCEDGSRVLFGSSVANVSHNDVAQRLFEVLEDGHIDYFIHAGLEPDGKVDLAAIGEFFPIKACAELAGDVEYPEGYMAFREDLEVEELEADDVLEFGATSIRLLGAEPRPIGGGVWRPLALHITHTSDAGSQSLLALGGTGGLDWPAISAQLEEPLTADCLIVDGRHPLDIVITSGGTRADVSVDHLRSIGPSSVVLGADPGGAKVLRPPALELYGVLTREHPGGLGVIEVKPDAWMALILDGASMKVEREARQLGAAA